MSFDLNGKKALVTGGAGGIGSAVARRFLEHGARVAIADVCQVVPDALPDGASFYSCDVSNEDEVQKVFDAVASDIGKLDVVVNNAGLTVLGGYMADSSAEYIESIQKVNVFGVFYGLKHGPRHMSNGGSIINTASLAAFYTAPAYGAYSMSKAAVVSLTRTAAIELGSRQIRVNAICPGHTRVDRPGMTDDEMAMLSKQCRIQCALGRIGEVEEQAAVFHFLAADASRYMTGQALIVDGGFSLGDSEKMYEAFAQMTEK
jgi:NAD(P)-dependent dehydrogenase (short-subunit alcohol dehydrogenase family)